MVTTSPSGICCGQDINFQPYLVDCIDPLGDNISLAFRSPSSRQHLSHFPYRVTRSSPCRHRWCGSAKVMFRLFNNIWSTKLVRAFLNFTDVSMAVLPKQIGDRFSEPATGCQTSIDFTTGRGSHMWLSRKTDIDGSPTAIPSGHKSTSMPLARTPLSYSQYYDHRP